MNTLLTVLLLLQVVRPIPGAPAPDAAKEPPDLLSAVAEPDVVYRGRSTTLEVAGASIEALKTLGVKPAPGVHIEGMKELPPLADGRKVMSVTFNVDRDADPGPRDLTVLLPPDIDMDPNIRGGADQRSRDMDEYYKSLVARGTRPYAVARFYVNAHTVSITAATLRVEGEYQAVEVTVVDDTRDFLAADTDLDDVLMYEAKCGTMTETGSVTRVSRAGAVTLPTSTSLRGRFLLDAPSGSPCTIRLRARDRGGNVTPWFGVKTK